jgi:hypothetical protein
MYRSIVFFLIFISKVAAWNQTEFMIFTFFDPCLSQETDTTNVVEVRAALGGFQKAQEAYFNLLTGTQESSRINHTQAGIDFALYVAGKVPGLKYLVNDNGFFNGDAGPAFRPCQPDTAARVTDHYAKTLAARFPARRNAIMGYNLGDEPRGEDVRNVKNWISHIKRSDPAKLAYVNVLPAYGFKSRCAYEAYLDTLIGDCAGTGRPDVVSFDHYPFFKDGKIRRDYFYNLRIIGQKAGQRPFWAYIQSVDHLIYVDPAAEHLRFMALCPIAYGAKGIGYFTYEQPDDDDYRDALVNGCDVQTPKYAIARTINHYLRKIIGPVVMGSTWRGAFHTSKKPTGETDCLLTPDNAPCIGAMSDENCLCGIFESRVPAAQYCLIVNKSLAAIHQVTITFKGDYARRIYKAPSMIDFAGDTAYTPVKTDGKTMIIPELQGGEGRFYRITRVANPP